MYGIRGLDGVLVPFVRLSGDSCRGSLCARSGTFFFYGYLPAVHGPTHSACRKSTTAVVHSHP